MEGGFCNAKTKSVRFLTTQQSGRCYDANHLLVLEFRIIGRGHSAADKLASVLEQFSLSLTVPDDLTELQAPATPSMVG